MIYDSLQSGILIKRYKRFLADIRLDSGKFITAHCPNSGSMLSCNTPQNPVMVSKSMNPKRKLAYTWELIQEHNTWIDINTHRTNYIVKEAIQNKLISELRNYNSIQAEVSIGNSRIDLLLKNGMLEKCYVEIKSVTLVEKEIAYFPDAVTIRGQKHLSELVDLAKNGNRAIIFFLVKRADAHIFQPAYLIDSEYGALLNKAASRNVEILVYRTTISTDKITIDKKLEYQLK